MHSSTKASNPHEHHHSHHASVKNIKVAFFLNICFAIVEIIGGLFTNSVAIVSDAIHDLGDSFSLGLAWYLQNLSTKKSTKTFSYGYKRFSILGAIINSIILVSGSIIVLYEAISRLFEPQPLNAKGIFILAIAGIIINGIAVLRFKKGQSLNEKVVSLHLLEDVLGWVAIFIGSIFIYFFKWMWIDPLLSIGISVFILSNVYKNLKSTLHILLQGTPAEIEVSEISDEICRLEGVLSVHDLHIWSIDGRYNIMTVHVVLRKNISEMNSMKMKDKIRLEMYKKNIEHITIELENENENCGMQKCCP